MPYIKFLTLVEILLLILSILTQLPLNMGNNVDIKGNTFSFFRRFSWFVLWTFPINLSEINTDGNDLLLGVDQEYFYLLRDNKVLTYSFKEPFIFISEEIIKTAVNSPSSST